MQILANGQPLEIEEGRRFTLLVHQQGIRVDVPEALEINSRQTISCMEKMNQKQWEWISTGEMFQELFGTLFPAADNNIKGHENPEPKQDGSWELTQLTTPGIPIPKTIDELNKSDFGIIHGCGMIVLGCEALFQGRTKLFFRTPEDHLHPKAERRIVGMLQKMMLLAGGTGTVTAEAKPEPPQ